MNRLQPESAPVRAILLAWPYADSDWAETLLHAENCYFDMLKAFSDERQPAETWVLLHPTIDFEAWSEKAVNCEANLDKIKVFQNVFYDDTWIRDYGPLSLSHSYFAYSFNGWGQKYSAVNDNQVAEQLSGILGGAFAKSAFVAEGGALEVNSDGVLLVNRDCIVDDKRNAGSDTESVELEFKQQLGIDKIIWLKDINLTGDDTDGHIDTIARFADAKTVLCCGRNRSHPDVEALENLNKQMEAVCNTQGWRLLSLPVPHILSRVDGRTLPATYANFLIANKYVYLPVYGVEEDKAALEIVKSAFPEHQVVAVRCEALLEQHGSLHCATMQISHLQK